MTALARARLGNPPAALAGWAGIAVIVGGLGAIVGWRAIAVGAGADGLAVGAVFGLALVGLFLLAREVAPGARRHGSRASFDRVALTVTIGAAFGLGLVAIAVIGPALAGVMMVPSLGRPAAPFAAWAAITILVATAEELLLRGVLLDRIGRAAGIVPAILLTSAVFALMHVPAYGWHVVPLDFAVGLSLAGLRLTTRSLLAPVAAHVVADLATWWL